MTKKENDNKKWEKFLDVKNHPHILLSGFKYSQTPIDRKIKIDKIYNGK